MVAGGVTFVNVQSSLIFDIGLHQGLDSEFYLSKGFSVIGVEARIDLCENSKERNLSYVKNGTFTIVNKALYKRDNETVKFYINPDKDDWGSLSQGSAEKGVGTSFSVEVKTTTLKNLIDTYGMPHYAKCDIEGGDAIFADQLLNFSIHPNFVSLEATSGIDIAKLAACGYDAFQIVNQYVNPQTACPFPAREGNYVDAHFNHHMSGLFGYELPQDQWVDFETLMAMWLDWYSLRRRNPNLAVGWLDVHATTKVVIKG